MHGMVRLMPSLVKSLKIAPLDHYFDKNWHPYIQQCIDDGQWDNAFLTSFSINVILLYHPYISKNLDFISRENKKPHADLNQYYEQCILVADQLTPGFISLADPNKKDIFWFTCELFHNYPDQIPEFYDLNAIVTVAPRIVKTLQNQLDGLKLFSQIMPKNVNNKESINKLLKWSKLCQILFFGTTNCWQGALTKLNGRKKEEMREALEEVDRLNQSLLTLLGQLDQGTENKFEETR